MYTVEDEKSKQINPNAFYKHFLRLFFFTTAIDVSHMQAVKSHFFFTGFYIFIDLYTELKKRIMITISEIHIPLQLYREESLDFIITFSIIFFFF